MTAITKLEDEKLEYSFDFSARAEVVAGDTLSGPAVTSDRRRGTGTLTITGVQVNGDTVEFTCAGGDLGDVFHVECTVATSGGGILAAVAQLTIIKD